MQINFIDVIKEKIVARHQGDERQLEVIFTDEKRILVEAPAGYGKTNTMVSKIAYMVATTQIPNPKKLLALTFSVNAAYKIKKDVSIQIPILLGESYQKIKVNDKVYVSNYHGFCRNVLRKHGISFTKNILNIDSFLSFDDSDIKKNMEAVTLLSYDDSVFLSSFSDAVKRCDHDFISNQLDSYCNIIVRDFLPIGIITYNAIIALTIKLFKENQNILSFYNTFYPSVLIDEFQDTNCLSYLLLSFLITDKTKVILLGDSLQRIYGFIGAVPNILSISVNQFKLVKIQLGKNYRFANNETMLQLDANIRRNAENPPNPKIELDANVNFSIYSDQPEESLEVVKKACSLLGKDKEAKVAILVKIRGKNVDNLITTFNINNIPFFYGLFTDEDFNYINFHKKALAEFSEILKSSKSVTKKVATTHTKLIKEYYHDKNDATANSLIGLLEIFWEKLFVDFQTLNTDEKIIFVKDVFEHNGLKQYMEFLQNRIIISTVHAAKGLEWDYVIIPDMEQDLFPNWNSKLCGMGGCVYKADCSLVVTTKNEAAFLEELSVFYVAVTRARKQVFFTASKKEINGYSKNISCFLKLPGIKMTVPD